MDRRLGAVRVFVSSGTYRRLGGLSSRLVVQREEALDVAVRIAEQADTGRLREVAAELKRERLREAAEAGR